MIINNNLSSRTSYLNDGTNSSTKNKENKVVREAKKILNREKSRNVTIFAVNPPSQLHGKKLNLSSLTSSNIIKYFQLMGSKIKFVLSTEIIIGIKNDRDSSHKVSQGLLFACLSKRIKTLNKCLHSELQKTRVVLSFNVFKEKIPKKFKIVGDLDPQNASFYLITAFFKEQFCNVNTDPSVCYENFTLKIISKQPAFRNYINCRS